MIEAKVICDSLNVTESGESSRLTTMELEMPRFILAEFNTHRVFSRNSASSRAIPFWKQVHKIIDDPFVPEVFMENKPGMQAAVPIEDQDRARDIWLSARDAAVVCAKDLGDPDGMNVHKQWVNRLLEPFMWHKVIVSSVEWDNFFVQRCDPAAQPEMFKLAVAMRDALVMSEPVKVVDGWHLPYVTGAEEVCDAIVMYARDNPDRSVVPSWISAANCARVSYLNHDGVIDVGSNLDLYARLLEGKHASPLEHVAAPVSGKDHSVQGNRNFGPHWIQLRQVIGM